MRTHLITVIAVLYLAATVQGDERPAGTVSLRVHGTPARQVIAYLHLVSGVAIECAPGLQERLERPVFLTLGPVPLLQAVNEVAGHMFAAPVVKGEHIVLKPQFTPPPSRVDPLVPIAAVNRVGMTQGDLSRAVGRYFPARDEADIAPRIRAEVLQRLLLLEARRQFIARELADLPVAPEQVAQELARVRARAEHCPAFKDVGELYSRYGCENEAAFVERTIIPDLKYSAFIAGRVSEQAVSAFFDEHREKFERVRASHILFARPEDPKAAETARAAARNVLAALRTGKDFGELARRHSACPSAERAGDVGWVSRQGPFERAFKDEAFRLGKDESSGLVETAAGIHIIRVTDTRRSLAELKEEIRAAVIRDGSAAHIEELRRAAKIDIIDNELKLLLKEK